MPMSLRAQTILYEDQVLYSLEDGFVSATKTDDVHLYSNVNKILLPLSSNLSGSPSTPRCLLIRSRLPKHHSFNQPNDTTPVASGPPASPIPTPFRAVTNSGSTPSSSPARRRWIGPLRRPPPQLTKVQEPQPPTISELVSEPTKLDLDPPTTLPTPWVPSRSSPWPPTQTRLVQQICHLITRTCSTATPRPACPTVPHFPPCVSLRLLQLPLLQDVDRRRGECTIKDRDISQIYHCLVDRT